jgi:hypothetical protein
VVLFPNCPSKLFKKNKTKKKKQNKTKTEKMINNWGKN